MIIYIAIVIIVLTIALCKSINKLLGLPPGPTPLPLIGNMHVLHGEPHEYTLKKLRDIYGPVFTLWLPRPMVVINDYDVIKRNVVKNGDAYAGRPETFFNTHFTGGRFGLVMEYNEWVKSQRAFTLNTLKCLGVGKESVSKTIGEEALKLVQEVDKLGGQPFELKPLLAARIGMVINGLVFGKEIEKDDEVVWFINTVQNILLIFGDVRILLINIIPWFRHFDRFLKMGLAEATENNKKILAYLQTQIDNHKQNIDYDQEPASYIDAYLVEIRRKQLEGPNDEFTEHQLKVAIYDLYAAGFETTVTSLRFVFRFLITHPECRRKCQEEIDSVIQKNELILYDDTKRLPYCNAFIQETYRVGYISNLALPKLLMEDTNLEGYELKKGTQIIQQNQTSYFDEQLFENPYLFWPERHIVDGKFVRHDAIQPFSVGKRYCLGESLARMEMFQLFTTLVQHFHFEPEGVVPPKPDVTVGFLRSPFPFKLRATRR